MDFDKIIEKRKSVRSFKDTKSDWKSAMLAIDCALKGPFAGNKNNLKFLIIEYPSTITKIAELSEQEWLVEAPLLIIVCSDDLVLEEMYGERGRVFSRQQAGAAINTIILKLTDLGLSSCWVGSYTDELIKQHLKIPSHIQIEAIIPVGKEGTVKKEKERKTGLGNSVYWEKWKSDKRPTIAKEPPTFKYPKGI